MRQHLGIAAVAFSVALAASLAWFVIEHSEPGYRTPPACTCQCGSQKDDAEEEDPDADDRELIRWTLPHPGLRPARSFSAQQA